MVVQSISPQEALNAHPNITKLPRDQRIPILLRIILWLIKEYDGDIKVATELRKLGFTPSQARHEQWWMTLGGGIVRESKIYKPGPNASDPDFVYREAVRLDRESRKK